MTDFICDFCGKKTGGIAVSDYYGLHCYSCIGKKKK